MTPPSSGRWLSEHRRGTVSMLLALAGSVLLFVLARDATYFSPADLIVIAMLAYLVTYLVVTVTAFVRASPATIERWARRHDRGTVLQRYVFGTAPGPGASLFIAACALAVAVLWLPGLGGTHLPAPVRVGVAVALVVVSWVIVVVSFAVAFYADNLVEGGKALDFPGDANPTWADYFYFAVAVMSTFGTTDVTVTSPEMRRTVTANAMIAFVFNTVTVATLVSALSSP